MKRLIALTAVLASAGICGLLLASSRAAATSVTATITAQGVITASTATGSMTFKPPLTDSSTSKGSLLYYPRQTSTISPNLPRPTPLFPGDKSFAVYVDGIFEGTTVLNWWGAGIAVSSIKVTSSRFTANAAGNEALVMAGTSKGSFPGPANMTLNSNLSSAAFNSELQNGGVSRLTFTSGAVTVGASPAYTFSTVDNQNDPTFNKLLGINDDGAAAGYFGSGSAGHPHHGYLVRPPYLASDYANESYPGSTQTQVAAVNDLGDTAGSFTRSRGADTGFVDWNGTYKTLPHPTQGCGKCQAAPYQILGLNDAGTAVGWYTTGTGGTQAYRVNQATGKPAVINIPGAVSSAATGINNAGDIVGYATSTAGVTSGWLLHDAQLTTLQYPGSSGTEAHGVSEGDEIVGTYTDSAGVQHGFTLLGPLTASPTWQSMDHPDGIGSTAISGVNGFGDLAGFYTDAAGNTDGTIITP